MIQLEASTTIDRPVEQVFEFVSTPENDFQWQYGILATARLYSGVSQIGTFFRSIGHLLGRRIQGIFEVVAYEPNRGYGFKSFAGPLHSQTSYTFQPIHGGTRITSATRARIVNFFEMDEQLLERKLKKQLQEDLALLKQLLEGQLPILETDLAVVLSR